MAEIELELPLDLNSDYLPVGEGLIHSLVYKNLIKEKIPVRVYSPIPDIVFVNAYVDTETGELLEEFPAVS